MDLDARLTVLGSLNMDISVTVPALPDPGATVLGDAAVIAPGGKGANQAVAAARLAAGSGIAVRMVGCVGDDDFGRSLRAALRREGVRDESVRTVPGVPTGIAMITVDQAGENIITVAPGANREVGPAEIGAVKAGAPGVGATEAGAARAGAGVAEPGAAGAGAAGRPGGASGVLVISAEVPVAAILAALSPRDAAASDAAASDAAASDAAASDAAAGGAAGEGRRQVRGNGAGPRPLTVLNLAPAPAEAADLVAAAPDWLIVNESEAGAALGRPVRGLTQAVRAAADLVAAGARHAVVTAGAAGTAYHAGRVEGSKPAGGTVAAFPVHALDTVGAGDTFVGALAVALAAGIAPEEAITAASAAAATAVTRRGTQDGMPRPADVRAVTGYAWPLPAAK